MAQPRPNAVLDFIRSQLPESSAASLPDRELLERFASRHDEGAFQTILRRHGPIVLRACQRVLKRKEDVEDVFQATFLVLARKAQALLWPESLGSWLYGVAYRLAQEARRKQLRQQAREAHALAKSADDPLAEITGRELVAILDEEVARLPERYRAPLLLLYLEGKSGDEAARSLRCSPRTFQRRLRKARELLQRRLNRRGFAVSVMALTALLIHNTVSASVPPTLAMATVRAASLLAAGKPLTAGLASAQAITLASGLSQALFLTKLKIGFGLVLLGACLVAGTYAVARQSLPASPVEADAARDGDLGGRPHPQVSDQARVDVSANSRKETAVGPARPLRPARGQADRPTVAASIETTLPTAAGQIRQFAFDGNSETFFASARNAGSADHFTLRFDEPVAVRSVAVTTGRPRGGDRLDAGVLEVSADGKTFEPLANFADGQARGQPLGRQLQAVRVRATANLQHPLAVREFTIESNPPVAIFKHPVEIVVDVTEAPEMRAWAEKVAQICERAYPLINEELKGDDHKPTHLIRLTLKNDYQGLAMASDSQITASVKYFKANPDDVGAIVFETVCCAQNYGGGGKPTWLAQVIAEQTWLGNRGADWQAWLRESNTPGLLPWDARQFSAVLKALGAYFASSTEDKGRDSKWLVEGIADYVRFFKYEPGKLQPLDPDRARYNKHSQDTAAFLAYLTQAYDKDIVRKLNQIVQKGKYRDEAFQALTGKTIRELGEEWRASLRRDRKLAAAPAAPG